MALGQLPKALNPKEYSDYLKMLATILEWHTEAWKIIEEFRTKSGFVDAFYTSGSIKEYDSVDVIFKKNVYGYANWDGKDHNPEMIFKDVEAIFNGFPKNNQIENLLKWYRAALAYDINLFEDEYLKIDWIGEALKKEDGSLYEEQKKKGIYEIIQKRATLIVAIFETIFERLKPLKKKTDSYWIKYYNNENLKTSANEHNSKPAMFTIHNQIIDLKHFVDSYNSEKQKYKKLMDVSWDNKTPYYLVHELDALENLLSRSNVTGEIVYEGSSKDTYENLLEKEGKKTEVYLDVGDGLVWYIFEGNRSSLESFIGTQGSGEGRHCGIDDAASVLFSLRSKNSLGQFILHATVSAKIHFIPPMEEGEKTRKFPDLVGVFETIQIKTRRNQPVPPRFWLALLKLYSQNEFGWQSHGDVYGQENNFNIAWLIGEQDWDKAELEHNFKLSEKEKTDFKKMYDKFLKSKPWWVNPSEAKKVYHIKTLQKEFAAYCERHFKNKGKKEYDKISIKGEDVNVEFSDFGVFLNVISSWNEHWHYLDKTLEDYDDVSPPDLDDSDGERMLEHLKEDDPAFYKKLEKEFKKKGYESVWDMVCNDQDDLPKKTFDAINSAWWTGWEVGTSDSKYKAIEKYFDGFECNSYEAEDNYATFVQDGYKWIIIFHVNKFEEYIEQNEGFPYPQLERREEEITWDYDYNEEAAYERLREEIPSA